MCYCVSMCLNLFWEEISYNIIYYVNIYVHFNTLKIVDLNWISAYYMLFLRLSMMLILFYCYRVGYHAFTSMNRLHLHVLSKDFCGPHMRQPHQWNSFNTEFFIPTHSKYTQDIGNFMFSPVPKYIL